MIVVSMMCIKVKVETNSFNGNDSWSMINDVYKVKVETNSFGNDS